MTYAPGDIVTYRTGNGQKASGRYLSTQGVGAKVHHIVQTKRGRKSISNSEIVETDSLTRFTCKEGQRVRLVRRNGSVYEGELRSWGELFITIRIDAGGVGYKSMIEDTEGVYALED